MFDVLVIGAGPAGSHAAGRLAASGLQVAVVEGDPEAGLNVCCTGIVGAPCMDLLDVPASLVYHRSRSAVFISPRGAALGLTRPEVVGHVIDRPGLDRLLAARAAAEGARYYFSSRVTDLAIHDRGVNATVEGPDWGEGCHLAAKVAVVATGFGSRIPRALGFGRVPDRVVAAQLPVHVDGLEEIEVYCDQELAPGGFAWLAPTAPGHGWVGLFARRDHGRALELFMNRLSHGGRVRSAGVGACYGAIPIQPLSTTVADRVVVVGEAAGQIKPTTGGGIYYSTLCAGIAADVIIQALASGAPDAAALAPYEAQWRAKLGAELKVGFAAHDLWRRMTNSEVELLFRVARRGGLPRLIEGSKQFSFDWHGPLLQQLAELLPGSERRLGWPQAASGA